MRFLPIFIHIYPHCTKMDLQSNIKPHCWCATRLFWAAQLSPDSIPADLLCGADGRDEPSLYHPGDELSTDGARWQPGESAVTRSEKSPLTLSEPSIEGCWLDTQWNTSLPPTWRHILHSLWLLLFLFFFGFCCYLTLSSLNWHTNVGADIAAFFLFFCCWFFFVFFSVHFLVAHTETRWHKNWPIRNSLQQGRLQQLPGVTQ